MMLGGVRRPVVGLYDVVVGDDVALVVPEPTGAGSVAAEEGGV